MKTFWRISNYANLSGEGGRIASARWHTEGRPIVYLAENPAGALLERIVHLSDRDRKLPRTYDLLEIAAPDNLDLSNLDPTSHAQWKVKVEITRALGDTWLAGRETPLARVPSVIVSYTWNVLLNPEHPDAGQVKVVSVIRERFDIRLFRSSAR